MKAKLRIGVYSGTFDPVHLGHVEFAKKAIKNCQLDKVYFLVEPRPRRKQGVKALEHRQAMVKLAIASQPKLGSIILQQARFSVSETLPVLQERFKGAEIAFLMGDDMLHYFTDADWPQLGDFINAVQLVIGLRSKSATEVREQIKTIEKTRGFKIKYSTFSTNQSAVSSVEVRKQLRKGNMPAGLPKSVIKYIKDQGLYTPL